MIRKISILAVVRLLFVPLTVGAASVTPSAATDYIFTTPLFPASIRGEVMGDPPAYYDARGEDVDWMFEAFEERFALISGEVPSQTTHLRPSFGKWNLSATNIFYRWSTAVDASGTTNVVVGYSLMTNAPRFSLERQDVVTLYNNLPFAFWSRVLGYETGASTDYRSRYLDGAAALATAARVAYDQYDVPLFTNVTYLVSYTNMVATNVSAIVMAMTNGTESVFTNKWTATFEFASTNAVTNVVEACPLDYCHALPGPFPGFPNAAAFDAAIMRPRRNGVTAQMYDALRAAVRLADDVSVTNLSPPQVVYSHQIYEDDLGRIETSGTTTNSTGFAGCSYEVDGVHERTYQNRVMYPHLAVSESRTPEYQAAAPTRFSSGVVTTGGTVRVEIDAAFAVVEFQYFAAHQEGDATNLTWATDSAIDKIVVVPIEGAVIDVSQDVAVARVNLDAMALCASSASAAGAPSLPEDVSAYSPALGNRAQWVANCSRIVVIYSTKPSSKFSSW